MQDKEQSYDFYVEVDGKPFNGNAAITQKDTEKSDDADTQDKTKEDKSENTAGTTVQICLCDVEVNYLIDKLCFGCIPFFYCASCLSCKR